MPFGQRAHTTFGVPTMPSLALPGLQGNEPLQLDEGPQGAGEIYLLPAWAKWRDHKRIAWLRENLVSGYSMDPRLRWFVVNEILRPAGAPPHDYPSQISALFSWVVTQVYYTQERGEQVQSVWRTIQQKTGDCDDSVVAILTMADALNLPNRFVLAGQQNGRWARWVEGSGPTPRGANFSHVFAEIGFPPGRPNNQTRWAAIDTILPGTWVGYDPTKHGVLVDRLGRPSAPSPENVMQYMQHGQATRPRSTQFYGGFGAAQEPTVLNTQNTGYEEPGIISQFFTQDLWRQLAVEVVSSVAGAVAIYLVLDYVERRNRRRK